MRRPFVVLWLATLLFYLGFQMLLPVMPLYAARLGAREADIGFIIGAFALAAMVLRPLVSLAVRSPAGRLSDRLGRRAVIAPALALTGASLVLLGMAFSRGTFLGAAALYGMGFGAGQPALLAMTGDRVPPAERGRAMGTLYTAWELGILGGSVLLGLCATRLGYEATWWIAAAIAWMGALAALRRGARPPG